jgi:hypothetical protein
MVEVLFFVTGLETLQIQEVEMSTGGSIESNARFICDLPSCEPRLRLGLQSLGSAQKDSLLLLMI